MPVEWLSEELWAKLLQDHFLPEDTSTLLALSLTNKFMRKIALRLVLSETCFQPEEWCFHSGIYPRRNMKKIVSAHPFHVFPKLEYLRDFLNVFLNNASPTIQEQVGFGEHSIQAASEIMTEGLERTVSILAPHLPGSAIHRVVLRSCTLTSTIYFTMVTIATFKDFRILNCRLQDLDWDNNMTLSEKVGLEEFHFRCWEEKA
ncbi:hypothetical protein M422DRAFT_239416 [Sphaerobolus stellatus SS14]|nr:hypothetical protein M422DRAFT_239416 [Sphaerobolus stellatus SS14]